MKILTEQIVKCECEGHIGEAGKRCNGCALVVRNLRSEPNKWGGTDARGAVGVARFIVEDGDRVVYFFNPNLILMWQATFSATAPDALFVVALDEARAQADGAK